MSLPITGLAASFECGRLSHHENVQVKVSAFWALGRRKRPYLDLGPLIRRVIDSFGPRRLMWATDCPWQVMNGHSYKDSIELVCSRIDFLTDTDRQYLLPKTADRRFLGPRCKPTD